MKSLWQIEAQRELSGRIGQLVPDRKADWGRMSPQQMVCHLTRSVQMAAGETQVAGRWTPFQLPGIKQFVLYYAPFPKNVPTAPELVVRQTPNPWSQDVADLHAAIGRFLGRGVEARWPPHPAFGALDGWQWGVLVYRHVDHHLRQFSV